MQQWIVLRGHVVVIAVAAFVLGEAAAARQLVEGGLPPRTAAAAAGEAWSWQQ